MPEVAKPNNDSVDDDDAVEGTCLFVKRLCVTAARQKQIHNAIWMKHWKTAITMAATTHHETAAEWKDKIAYPICHFILFDDNISIDWDQFMSCMGFTL